MARATNVTWSKILQVMVFFHKGSAIPAPEYRPFPSKPLRRSGTIWRWDEKRGRVELHKIPYWQLLLRHE